MKKIISFLAIMFVVTGCSSGLGTAMSLYEQLGGSDVTSKLASDFLGNAMGDSSLTSLLGNVDTDAVSPKLANQLCSVLGGGCDAPLSASQIADGASKVSSEQASALSDAFNKSMGDTGINPTMQNAVDAALGDSLGGIVGGLL